MIAGKLRIVFAYDKHDDKSEETACILKDKESDSVLAIGTTKMNPSDKPDRRLARKIALQRALNVPHAKFEKTLRAEVWRVFWSRVRKPD